MPDTCMGLCVLPNPVEGGLPLTTNEAQRRKGSPEITQLPSVGAESRPKLCTQIPKVTHHKPSWFVEKQRLRGANVKQCASGQQGLWQIPRPLASRKKVPDSCCRRQPGS